MKELTLMKHKFKFITCGRYDVHIFVIEHVFNKDTYTMVLFFAMKTVLRRG